MKWGRPFRTREAELWPGLSSCWMPTAVLPWKPGGMLSFFPWELLFSLSNLRDTGTGRAGGRHWPGEFKACDQSGFSVLPQMTLREPSSPRSLM